MVFENQEADWVALFAGCTSIGGKSTLHKVNSSVVNVTTLLRKNQ